MTTKAFYLRSEFWVALVTGIVVIGNEGIGLDLPKAELIAFATSMGSYVVSRGWAKSGTTDTSG